jgi:hypothetical protein
VIVEFEFVYDPDVVGHVVVLLYIHFVTAAHHRLAVIVSLVTGHASTGSVNDNVGACVSISFHVTVNRSVVFSLSFTLTVHVSLHVLFGDGVYVIVFDDTLHTHFDQFDVIVSYDIFPLPQLHSAALPAVFQLLFVVLFHTLFTV